MKFDKFYSHYFRGKFAFGRKKIAKRGFRMICQTRQKKTKQFGNDEERHDIVHAKTVAREL
jgi:hypothetical protein